MEPKIAHISRFLVSGLTVRTINRDEFNEETAKIPGLWAQFFASGTADKIPQRLPDTPIVGVYSTYDSDLTSFYNVTAGVSVATLNPDFSSIEVQKGKYLVFEANGPIPTALFQAWSSIWAYFEQHPHVQRSYLTDFELYSGPEEVQIHIGVAS